MRLALRGTHRSGLKKTGHVSDRLADHFFSDSLPASVYSAASDAWDGGYAVWGMIIFQTRGYEMKDMEERILIRPEEEWADEIADYRREFLAVKSPMDGTGALKSLADPYEFIEDCRRGENRETVRPGLVPATQFLYVNKDTHCLIGMIQIRHELNDSLRKLGGHIGYSIRPSMRGHSEAKTMLGLGLDWCRKNLDAKEVMISCAVSNPASEHTILAWSGRLRARTIDPETGEPVHIYFITL